MPVAFVPRQITAEADVQLERDLRQNDQLTDLTRSAPGGLPFVLVFASLVLWLVLVWHLI